MGQSTSKPYDKSNATCNFCGEKRHWANKCQSKASIGLHNVLDMEIHAGTTETAKKNKENSKETSNGGNTFLQWAWSQPRLLMDVHSTGAPSAHCPGGLPTQQ